MKIISIFCLYLYVPIILINASKNKNIAFVSQINGIIAAFADFDSDRFTDVFIISDDGKTLRLLKSREDSQPVLQLNENVKFTFKDDDHIYGVIPADFNGDAFMDVLLVTKTSYEKDYLKIWILYGNKTCLNYLDDIDNPHHKLTPILKNAYDHPLILDYNGDMIADFLVETEECSRELWLGGKNLHRECLIDRFGQSEMRRPNSNAFVNVRNCQPGLLDFTTDIVLTTKDKIEYWLNRDGRFDLDNRVNIRYPDESIYRLGQSAFIDLNIDGCIEHIMIASRKEDDTPQILWYDNKRNEWLNIADFSNHSTLYFEELRTVYGFVLPMTLRFGDVDSDGFTDLIVVMKNKTSEHEDKNIAVILRNIQDEEVPHRRKFIFYWTSEALIEDNVEIASFIDLQENGKLDIILTTRNSSDQYHIKWIINDFVDNSCFLKILVASGLCADGSNGDVICPDEQVPYGTNQAGPFICYETSDVDGNPIKGCSTQLSQSAHFALQMPYQIFGLGETPNFVETVTASIPSGEMSLVRKSRWTQIVPDAQVVLVPYPPNDTAYWICKLFYTPSNMVSSTLAALALLCALLIIIILILHRKEVLEDLAEHQEYKRHWPESR